MANYYSSAAFDNELKSACAFCGHYSDEVSYREVTVNKRTENTRDGFTWVSQVQEELVCDACFEIRKPETENA